MKNLLIDKLPQNVKIEGLEYPINHDFRTSIRFEILMQEDEKSNDEKLLQVLKLYYGDTIPKNVDEAVEKIVWFYSCGKYQKSYVKNAPETEEQKIAHTRAYSFNHDQNYIYSAFWQQYGIDLSRAKLHWWQFNALFKSLTEDCLFTKIMHYRTVKITSKMPKSEQERLRLLKDIYALPLNKSEQQQLDAIEQALMGNGDVSALF